MRDRGLVPILLAAALLVCPGASRAAVPCDTVSASLWLDMLSGAALTGLAGDFAAIDGQIRNTGPQPMDSITTYLSLVDMQDHAPVDLEDWSAEKGLFVGTIEPGQVFPLQWRLHFIKAGSYVVALVAMQASGSRPVVSGIARLQVKPKRTLNPGKVLPVALCTPVVLVFLLLMANYRPGRTPTRL
jgi:hypothetical protein